MQEVDIENQGGEKHKPALAFTPMTLAIRNLVYSVPLPGGASKDLLQGVDAHVKPGSLTALMGSSGAGKTTLLDVIAGKKTSGAIKGDLYVNGAPINMSVYSRITVSPSLYGILGLCMISYLLPPHIYRVTASKWTFTALMPLYMKPWSLVLIFASPHIYLKHRRMPLSM